MLPLTSSAQGQGGFLSSGNQPFHWPDSFTSLCYCSFYPTPVQLYTSIYHACRYCWKGKSIPFQCSGRAVAALPAHVMRMDRLKSPQTVTYNSIDNHLQGRSRLGSRKGSHRRRHRGGTPESPRSQNPDLLHRCLPYRFAIPYIVRRGSSLMILRCLHAFRKGPRGCLPYCPRTRGCWNRRVCR